MLQAHHSEELMYSAKNEIQDASIAMQEMAREQARYSVMLKPKLFIDGVKWCALYGENLQDGIVGFGNSPDEAMRDFDSQFSRKY